MVAAEELIKGWWWQWIPYSAVRGGLGSHSLVAVSEVPLLW